jgi:site-specific recombinase XerD
MIDISKLFGGMDALAKFTADRSRLLRDMQPALELARQYEEKMRPFLESARRHEEAMRPMLDVARLQKEAVRPLLEATQRQQDTLRHLGAAFQLNDPGQEFARQFHVQQLQLAESLGKAMALTGIVDETKALSDLAERWRSTFDRFGDLTGLAHSGALGDIQRLAESVRLSSPDFPTPDSGFLGGAASADQAAVLERFRLRAKALANDPDAGVEDVEALVAEAQAVSAATPAETRSRMNGYMLIFFCWLLDKAAEDPAKELIHNAVAVLIMVLTTVAPPDLPQRPSLEVPGALSTAAVPDPEMPVAHGGWRADGLPDIIRGAGPDAERLTLGFLSGIPNANTRAAYEGAVLRFTDWCESRELTINEITPFVVRAYAKQMQSEYAAGTVRQHLAAIRLLFNHLVAGGVIPMNPAAAVRTPQQGPRKQSRTPPLRPEEARAVLESIPESDASALRDRALLAVVACTGARASSVAAMVVQDYSQDGDLKRVRLRGRGGALRDLPVDQTAGDCVDAYLDVLGAAGEPQSPLWRTMTKERAFSDRRMSRVDVFRMIRRRRGAEGQTSIARGEAQSQERDKQQ